MRLWREYWTGFQRGELAVKLARLNHVLIPDKKEQRDALRQRRGYRLAAVGFNAMRSLTKEGIAVLLLLLPVALASLDVRYSQVHLLLAMLSAALLSALLLRPFFGPEMLRARVEHPRRVTLGQPMLFEVGVRNVGAQELLNLRVIRPFLPWDGAWQGEVGGAAAVGAGQEQRLQVTATFRARGEHHLDCFEVGRIVVGGLAVAHPTYTAGARFLVLPRPVDVRSVSLDLRGPEAMGNSMPNRQAGESDIEGVRPYRVGDPLRHLHARTWARTGTPHVRHHVEEGQQRVSLVVLTVSEEVGERVKEATLSLAAGVARRLLAEGAGIDVLGMDSELFQIVPRYGGGALEQILDRLAVKEWGAASEPQALLQAARSATALILLGAGPSQQLRELATEARRAGTPTQSVVVLPPDPGEGVEGKEYGVSLEDVEQGREIHL